MEGRQSLDAAAVKETLNGADEVLPCRILTSNVEKLYEISQQVRNKFEPAMRRTLPDEDETFTGFNMELG